MAHYAGEEALRMVLDSDEEFTFSSEEECDSDDEHLHFEEHLDYSCKRLLPANQWLLVDLTDSDTIASDQSEVAQGVSNFSALPEFLSTHLFYGKRSVVVVPADPAISDNEGSDEEDDDVADPDFIPPAHNLDTPCSSDMGPSAKRKCVRPVWRSLRMMMTTMRMKTSQHHKYFSPQVIKHITYQTNLNATQKDINTTFTTTEEEMRNFVAILLYMGISELPSIDDYWVMETRVQVANLMSSKRFRLMRSLVHFNDNTQIPGTTDRFFKVRPLFSLLVTAFRSEPQTPKQSVDEVMVAYKGKTSRTSQTNGDLSLPGLRRTALFMTWCYIRAKLHWRPEIVFVLANTMTSPTTTAIFADNYFTSLEIVRYLKDKNSSDDGILALR
ncbi:hypothetical protein QQF64_018562 [Cirrhinus molitorella]|uniref:PiggyBac transposable element-derived protein domain-containing protein n=1 Tax=Cirrhinus molitorella TaxID=172907 RepID=A0ABR3LFJ4_9TELE